jgi:HSP20 family protein
MVHMIRRDPFTETLPAAAMMNRLMERFFNEPFLAEPTGIDEGLLPLDISEDDKSVVVRASLPGFSKDEIDVQVHNGIVSINAEHKEEHEEKGERFVRRERRYGSLSRRVALPTNVKEDQCEAELRNGELILRIPRSEEAMPRKIQIREGGGRESVEMGRNAGRQGTEPRRGNGGGPAR